MRFASCEIQLDGLYHDVFPAIKSNTNKIEEYIHCEVNYFNSVVTLNF